MTPLPILLVAVFLGTGNCSSKIVHGSFFLQYPPRLSWSLSEIYVSVIEIFWNEVFMVRNVVTTGQSWRSTVMEPGRYLWERSAIPTQSCLKDHGDSFSRLLVRKKDLINIYWEALVSGFANILVYFNKKKKTKTNNVETARYFFFTN